MQKLYRKNTVAPTVSDALGFNGKLASSFGQLFQAVDPASELAMAA